MFSRLQDVLTPVKASSAVIVQSLHGSENHNRKPFPSLGDYLWGEKKKRVILVTRNERGNRAAILR